MCPDTGPPGAGTGAPGSATGWSKQGFYGPHGTHGREGPQPLREQRGGQARAPHSGGGVGLRGPPTRRVDPRFREHSGTPDVVEMGAEPTSQAFPPGFPVQHVPLLWDATVTELPSGPGLRAAPCTAPWPSAVSRPPTPTDLPRPDAGARGPRREGVGPKPGARELRAQIGSGRGGRARGAEGDMERGSAPGWGGDEQ